MSTTDDPIVQDMADQEPFAQEVARYANDPAAILRLLEELASKPQGPTFPSDESATLTQLGGMERSDWPIVLVTWRFAKQLHPYYGRPAMQLRVSEVRHWLSIRLEVHRRFPSQAKFLEHLHSIAPEAVDAKEVAVVMADHLSACFGKPASSLSWSELVSWVRLGA